jgi:hypothetical protein
LHDQGFAVGLQPDISAGLIVGLFDFKCGFLVGFDVLGFLLGLDVQGFLVGFDVIGILVGL